MKGIFGKFFQTEPSLDELIRESKEREKRDRYLLMSGAVKSYDNVVYQNGKWMIRYCFNLPASMEDAFRKKDNTFTMHIADITDYADPHGDGMPRPLLVFNFDEEPDRSFAMFANQFGGIGNPDGKLKSLNYLKILQHQPVIPIVLIGSNEYYMEIENPASESSLLYMLRTHMDEFFAKPGSRNYYRDRISMDFMEIEHTAREHGLSTGRYCLERYRGLFLNTDL